MWSSRSVRVLRHQRWLSTCALPSSYPNLTPVKLYVIAGEASGDAIGAKVIRALQRHQPTQSLEFRGIGGPQMCKAGDFESLFPMQELSVMGLLEVVPHMWRLRRRIQDTLQDIEAYQPELVLTIDSKGFTFRILKALHANEHKSGIKRIKKAQYVAPSVWAYKHRGKRDFTELKTLLDVMFTILPFEEDIFRAGEEELELEKSNRSWCHFVGHPAVEDFLEANGVFESSTTISSDNSSNIGVVETGTDALLDLSNYDPTNLLVRGQLFRTLATNGREPSVRTLVREEFNIPTDAFVICALVGSRVNEVKKSSHLVLNAIDQFKQAHNLEQEREIYVVFPTIGAVEGQVNAHLSASSPRVKCRVLTDLDVGTRFRLFQCSDAAVAVSGTIVLETTLASLPTIVIYRANMLTEWVVQRLTTVRFVSVPNLLLGRSLIPEFLFSECTAPKIAEGLRTLHKNPTHERDTLHLAMAVSTLTKWQESNAEQGKGSNKVRVQPIRASDVAAKHIINVLAKS